VVTGINSDEGPKRRLQQQQQVASPILSSSSPSPSNGSGQGRRAGKSHRRRQQGASACCDQLNQTITQLETCEARSQDLESQLEQNEASLFVMVSLLRIRQ